MINFILYLTYISNCASTNKNTFIIFCVQTGFSYPINNRHVTLPFYGSALQARLSRLDQSPAYLWELSPLYAIALVHLFR